MKLFANRYFLVLLFSGLCQSLFAQSPGIPGGGVTWLVLGLLVLLVFIIMGVADGLMKVEAKEMGFKDVGSFSVMPGKEDVFGQDAGSSTSGNKVVKLKKGHNIQLAGAAKAEVDSNVKASHFSVSPMDFIGGSPIPKVLFPVGGKVKAGDSLFFDKKRPSIMYASPVSGEVVGIERGEKRAISAVVIKADEVQEYRSYDALDLAKATREELVNFLLDSGVWPMIRQRPYELVADPKDDPKCIYISTFDSAPLAADKNIVIEGKGAAFQKGLDVLGMLSSGGVHMGLNAKGAVSDVYRNATGVKKHWFAGPHPAGNIGVQLHHVNPINKGDIVWTLDVQAVASIGALFTEGRYNAERVIAICGNEIEDPRYFRTYQGANIRPFIKDNVKGDNFRVISGDVLSGAQVDGNGYIKFFDDQVTVISEGDEYELFGWLLPLAPRPSISKTFPAFLMPDFKFEANTNSHGERRAFVITGQYESVLPMDIYPQHLMKSILFRDYNQMEGLGIYELAPEDVALCEFVCTSKQPLQKILSEGLEEMRMQG